MPKNAAPTVLRFPVPSDTTLEPTPQPGPDGYYRDTVFEQPVKDMMGRRQFTAADGNGNELLTMSLDDGALTGRAGNMERIRAKLWERVYLWRDRDKPYVVK